jgi:hypothetical protein
MRTKLVFATAIVATFLSGCGTNKYADDPFFDAGFSDGCSTGTSRSPGAPPSKPIRDDKLWDISDAYKAGWKNGYGACSPGGRSDGTGSDRDIGGR